MDHEQDRTRIPAIVRPPPARACTVSRDLEAFDLLIDDMEAVFGAAWGDLDLDAAAAYLEQSDAAELEALVIAVGVEDAAELDRIGVVVAAAPAARRERRARRAGTSDRRPCTACSGSEPRPVIPYPLPEGELAAAVSRLRAPAPARPAPPMPAGTPRVRRP